MASKNTSVSDAGTPKLKVPEGNDNILEKAAAPIATIASHADPWPHYLMTGACGLSAFHSWANLNNPRMAALKAALGVTYLYAGRQLVTGNPTLGYDLGTVASLALVGIAGPRAQATNEASAVAMTALGGISGIANPIKSYETRTGKPKELGYERS
eukprot:GHRR01016696.1.p1 GENE.GHRR01016696.1~~GHRR01016696.1.p1  ORF type:complete len:156 (-),score=48.87 GHRR01016696.1:250-717(-)